jgi:molecular chaperone DnaK
MSNDTISIGIDLGTTNSSVAVNVNGNIEIIKKAGGVEFTPSVFGFDKSGNKIVGQKAYDYLYKHNSKDEINNFKAEIKRQMGTPEKVHFQRPNKKLSPEEISAEIIKSLKEDVLRKYPEINDVAAVITIPAAFSVLQSEATKRAGNLAGFKHVVLLQEPIAAAVSYGFNNSKNENWIVYDFGGGTFDVALISCKDGLLSVIGHNGDNFLGGKNIDWDIVEKIIVPKIKNKYQLKNFTRKNKDYASIFSKLKYYAEISKIELSDYKKTTIDIEGIGKDDENKDILLSISFSRKEFEDLIEPRISRTIELTKEVLEESGIKSSLIKKIILVGGPTQIPYIKTRLENDLKINVDSSVDPLTVVSHGACVYALSQKIPSNLLKKDTKNKLKGSEIQLNYETLTSDSEESITGIIKKLDDNEQYYIQIQSDSGTFTGEKTKINNGKFFYTVSIEPKKQNKFWIFLFDSKGKPVKLSTDSFIITHGLSVSGAPIPHSINVVVSSQDFTKNIITNVCEKVFEKGEILPLKKTIDIYKTSRKLKKGEDASLHIEILEGESEIPDRNTFLCQLGIKGKDLPHDLPAGTPVELTLENNESRELIVTAYIPLIDMTLNARSTNKDEKIDSQDLSNELAVQKIRAEEISENCNTEERKKINKKMQSVSRGIDNSSVDEDEKRKANKELKDIKILLDDIEEDKAMPQLIKEFNASEKELSELVEKYVDEKDKLEYLNHLTNIRAESKKAINDKNKTLLIRINEQLDELIRKAIWAMPGTWVQHFRELAQNGNFTNQQEADYYIKKGIIAIEKEDFDELKRIVSELSLLIPEGDVEKTILSGIKR